jgi:hypothetical protein
MIRPLFCAARFGRLRHPVFFTLAIAGGSA